eukprot:gene17463-9071_t
MSVFLKRFLKLTCAAVSLSWVGSQGLLLYHLKFGKSKVPIEAMSSEAIPLTTRKSREGLVDAVRRLYSLDYSKERMNFFVENATFEDPAVFLCGKATIASGFSKMESLFKESEGLKFDIIHGDKVIAIDQVQRYTLPGDISFELPSIIYLYLEGEPGNEKIVRQVEEWGVYKRSGCSSSCFFLHGRGSASAASLTLTVSSSSYFASDGLDLGFLQQHAQHDAKIRMPNKMTERQNAARVATGSLWNQLQK